MGQISKYVGISKDTIRHWQKKGILDINKDDNNYNVFTDEDFFKTFKINLYRELGMSISNIKELLNKEDIDEKKDIISHYIKEIDNEIEKLINQRNVLKRAKDLPTTRNDHFEVINKTFKLKKVHTNTPANFSDGDFLKDKQIFITDFGTKSLENHDIYIEVPNNADVVYVDSTFIHFYYPREKLEESSKFTERIKMFALKNKLQLMGKIIEVHDLKQLLISDDDYIEFYVEVKG
ncbi:MerR family transcriptional regulator [Cytobacillus sp. IB215665]|uniref:MerR family transcriptional regulator n=1 Tax=Cytobacillus sp. IB215665 TaxID=3097357 RepID=UPI002A156CAD|nr:MerR family transcriptional regulator [Cytobacillus sp. IB215665]MDX8366125.1 MerR family transcriptional regulator [Cytobacillus sp. IB215665]